MKRILILLVAAGLVYALPATALAGKPDKPEPATADVTITYVDEVPDQPALYGIATTCPGSLVLDYDERPKHSVQVWDKDWAGNCIYLDLVGLEPGCYCAYHEDNEDPAAYAGVFQLTEQRDGTVGLATQFERLWRITDDKKGRPVSALESMYLLGGTLNPVNGPFSWDLHSGGGTLTGELLLQSFSTGGIWTEVSETPVTITVEW